MRIVIDMQGAQTESRFRGIGRYTMAFAQAVVRNRGEHEIILTLSGLFPDTIEPIRVAFDSRLPPENILVWSAPDSVEAMQDGNETRREVAKLLREAFIANLQPDVIHISSLFEGYVDNAVTSIGLFDRETAVSVTLHDLIPLLNPDRYLKPNPRYEQFYLRKIEFLKNASCFLAVSESSEEEGKRLLVLPDKLFVNTLEAVEGIFSPQTMSDGTEQHLRKKFSISRPFVLYTGGADERKNLPRLIEAYSALSANLRDTHQLVFAGKMPEGDVARLKHLARHAGIKEEEFVFTGYVSDEDLIQLYNLCQLYVFPSWHEGFGLPALEAMACGAPVIGANTTSLPEVIGLDEALFDPFDVNAITVKMAQALQNEDFRQHLRVHGLQQAKKFSWDETAKRAILSWEGLQGNCSNDKRDIWRQISGNLKHNYLRLIDSIVTRMTVKKDDIDNLLTQIALSQESNELELDYFLRPTRLPDKITWRIEGPFDSSYSLALVNREIARALFELGQNVMLHSTEGPGDYPPNINFLVENPDIGAMHRLSTDVEPIDADIVSRNLYPPRVNDMAARFNFLHAYGWEESGFPLDWVEAFNHSLQGMTVMSEHVRKIMIDHGVTVPIAVSSLGVDHWQRIQPDENYQLQAKSFRFLHVSSCFPRKGADVMLRAYGQAFRAIDDVTLVIKTFPNPHNEIHRWLEEARADDPGYPDVLILETDYSDAQLKALYGECHALLAPSRAEGFGLPMAEAILSGLAVITTGWSGQTDFCTQETAWLIDYSFARAKTHLGLTASVWAEPDEIHLASLMKEVFQTTESVRNARIASGQRVLLEKFNWSNTALRMLNAARECSQHKIVKKPHIGWITTWNTRCGIATYSEHIISNLPDEVSILAAHTESKLGEDNLNVYRCWFTGDHDDLTNLAQIIEKNAFNTLVIQFNYGFFNLETFGKLLTNQIECGRIITVIMHATIDPAHDPHKKLILLVPALKRCHRILVHSPNDMNRLKKLGVIENVTLYPHGIIDYISSEKSPFQNDRTFVVASYGFFLPHKGLLELIDAISVLHGRGDDVRLNMINAAYPAPQSISIIEEAKRKIEIEGLNQSVLICTDFLSDDQSLEKLTNADLIIFPYQDTGESASGAVRYGIASGRPVAVTPLQIFEDVESAVHYLPGHSPEAIADGISTMMMLNDSESLKLKQENALRWRQEHSYSKIARRLYGMLIALHIRD